MEKDGEQMAEGQVLEHEVRAWGERGAEGVEDRDEERWHSGM